MTRRTTSSTSTVVERVCKPLGRERENGLHLVDLRAFVDECEGLPNHLLVRVAQGYMSESGRYDTTLRDEHVVAADPVTP